MSKNTKAEWKPVKLYCKHIGFLETEDKDIEIQITCNTEKELKEVGDYIILSVNVHNQLVKALEEISKGENNMAFWEMQDIAAKALAAAKKETEK